MVLPMAENPKAGPLTQGGRGAKHWPWVSSGLKIHAGRPSHVSQASLPLPVWSSCTGPRGHGSAPSSSLPPGPLFPLLLPLAHPLLSLHPPISTSKPLGYVSSRTCLDLNHVSLHLLVCPLAPGRLESHGLSGEWGRDCIHIIHGLYPTRLFCP